MSSVANAASTTGTIPKQKPSTKKTSSNATTKSTKKPSQSKVATTYKRPGSKSRAAAYSNPKHTVSTVAPPKKAPVHRERTKSPSRGQSGEINEINLGFDIKPYLAMIVLLIAAFKTGYRRNSFPTVRNRNYWEANHVRVSRRKISSSYF